MPMLSESCLQEIQNFYQDFFGIRYDICEKFGFDLGESFPFMKPLLILGPSGIFSWYLIKKLEGLGIKVECDPSIEWSFSERQPNSTLKVINWSDQPTKETLGKSPQQIESMIFSLPTHKSFLSLNEYLIATGLIFATTGKFLEERFSTYFPEITNADGVSMARSDVRPMDHRLIITSGNSSVGCGPRIAFDVPWKF
jgi:hypothetical protein